MQRVETIKLYYLANAAVGIFSFVKPQTGKNMGNIFFRCPFDTQSRTEMPTVLLGRTYKTSPH
jgi:hypothetical protein